MSKSIRSDLDFLNVAKISNLPDGIADQSPATVKQLNAAIEGVKSKTAVVVSTQGNLNLAAPGATIDTVTMVIGDRFLARAQTTSSQNGIYIYNGAATAATRASDFDSASEVTNALVPVDGGTDAGVTFRQTATSPVIGTDPVTFITFGTSVPDASTSVKGKIQLATQSEVNTGTDALKAVTPATLSSYTGLLHKYATDIGDGAATQYDVTHNLSTNDVQVTIFDNSTKEDVIVDTKRQSTTVVRLNFNTAPTSNQFRVVVIG